jgi:predicted RNase H-like HicB family nuclease
MQDDGRIAKMADNVASDITGGDETIRPTLSNSRTAMAGDDEDVALANVDQAFDAILAAFAVIDDNLPRIKIENVPQKAAVDVIKDLMETALKPYMADALKALQNFGK